MRHSCRAWQGAGSRTGQPAASPPAADPTGNPDRLNAQAFRHGGSLPERPLIACQAQHERLPARRVEGCRAKAVDLPRGWLRRSSRPCPAQPAARRQREDALRGRSSHFMFFHFPLSLANASSAWRSVVFRSRYGKGANNGLASQVNYSASTGLTFPSACDVQPATLRSLPPSGTSIAPVRKKHCRRTSNPLL